MRLSLSFLEALRLPVDWKKSYCWAVQRADRIWLQKDGQLMFPTEDTVPCVTVATDWEPSTAMTAVPMPLSGMPACLMPSLG